MFIIFFFFFSSRRRHTRLQGDWSSDVCSSDLSRTASGVPRVARAKAARWHVLLPCVAAAIAGTLLSVEAWHGSRLREERLAELEFNARSEDYRSVLQTGIDNYIDKIQSLQALFGTVPNVSRQQFLDYANALLGGHPAILAVSWVPRVSNAERAQHERMGLREGYVNYHIRSQQPDGSLAVAPPASEYFPVLYSSVATPN